MAAMIPGVLIAVCGAAGLFWLVQAFVTGRALGGGYGSSDRATQPVSYWLNVAGLLVFVAGCAIYLVLHSPLSHLVLKSAFEARHPLQMGGDIPESPQADISAAGCEQAGPRVCLVIVGAGPDVPAGDLARYLSNLFGRPVGMLTPIALTSQAEGLPVVNEQRRQAGADAIERLVCATYPTLWRDPEVSLLAVTGHDLWIESRPGQRYVFGAMTVRATGGGVAVVSSARMDPAAYGRPPDPALLERRMRVLAGKYLAMLLDGEKPSADPTSPLYGGIKSPEDLDHMQLLSPSH
jgi:hypothetical protein